MSKEVAVKDPAALPAGYSYGEDAGAGFEGTKSSDLSIPFLAVLQSNSKPVVQETVPGAKAGMLYNTVTRELIPGEKGVVLLPCHMEVAYVEWVPLTKGGGFVGLHDPEGETVKKAIDDNEGKRIGKLHIGENELIETHYVYNLVLSDDGSETLGFVVVAFTSTKIKVFRDWKTAMYTMKGKPPLFANRARLRTVKQQNDSGTFYNFQIDPLRETWLKSLIDPKEEGGLIAEAREFRKMVTTGIARAAFDTQNATGDDGAEQAGGGKKAPF